MIESRPYQDDLDTRRRSSTALRRCIQSPTGSGKSQLIRRAALESVSLIALVHREYLVDQLAEIIPDAQVIKAGGRWDGRSKKIVGMVQTLRNRDLPEVEKIITDECHHRTASSYDMAAAGSPDSIEEGFTATPQRPDGRGLDDHYDDLICGPQYGELIEDGYLKPFQVFSVPSGIDASSCRVIGGEFRRGDQNEAIRKSTIFGDVVEHWHERCRDGAHISFWPSIQAAEHAAESVQEWAVLHSKLPRDVIKERIRALETGALASLATVDMVGEGLNIHGIQSVSECRLTNSLTVYLQQCGRANRGGGSGFAKIMDHVQNWSRHGLPDADRKWSLKGRVKRKVEPGSISVWDCPECWFVNHAQAQSCQQCGKSKPRELVVIEEREARLLLIKSSDLEDVHDVCSTPEQYREFARRKGKQPGWAAHQWWKRKQPEIDQANPFEVAGGQQKPSKREFMRAAYECGLNPTNAAMYAKMMKLAG